MLCGSAGEHAADLADQRALHPVAAGLVEEVAHLRAHVAEACGRSEDDGVVVRELVHGRDGSGLVQLHAGPLRDLLRHQLGNTLDRDLSAWYCASPLGDRDGHLLAVAVGAIVEDENLRHRPNSFDARLAVCLSGTCPLGKLSLNHGVKLPQGAITTSQPCRRKSRIVAALMLPFSACCAQPARSTTRLRT